VYGVVHAYLQTFCEFQHQCQMFAVCICCMRLVAKRRHERLVNRTAEFQFLYAELWIRPAICLLLTTEHFEALL